MKMTRTKMMMGTRMMRTSDEDDEDDEGIPLQDDGPDACSKDKPCKQCQGDCDNDMGCVGEMICCFRNKSNDPVPSCSGVENLDNGKSLHCFVPAE